jgi:integrase
MRPEVITQQKPPRESPRRPRRFLCPRPAYDLALDTGARQGELLALHWPDVDWAGGFVSVGRSLYEKDHAFRLKPPKSRAGRRRVKLAPRTLAVLASHRERMRAEGRDVDQGHVFVNADGGWVSKPSL